MINIITIQNATRPSLVFNSKGNILFIVSGAKNRYSIINKIKIKTKFRIRFSVPNTTDLTSLVKDKPNGNILINAPNIK